jgi:hypothetical protein
MGVLVYGILALTYKDIESIGGVGSWVWLLFKSLIFAIVLYIQAWFSAIVFGLSVSSFVYSHVTTGEIGAFPIFYSLLDWTFSSSPLWLGQSYSVFQASEVR